MRAISASSLSSIKHDFYNWLLSDTKKNPKSKDSPAILIACDPAPAEVNADAESITAQAKMMHEDHMAWLSYLSARTLGDMKRGISLKDEYAQWMANRAYARAAEARRAKVASKPPVTSGQIPFLHPADSGYSASAVMQEQR